jgi:polyisoprenoid-binding protein YceI
MKKCILFFVLLHVTAVAQQRKWKLDHFHSNLNFSITHLMVNDVEGNFQITEATITTLKEDFTDAVVQMKADVRSVDTGNDKRDTHLKSADFFDAEKYPDIIFTSTSFVKSGDNRYTVTGDLSMHGIVKPVTLEAIVKTAINPMSNESIAGFKVSGIIRRTDFNLTPDTPDSILSNDVMVKANVEFIAE